MQRSKGVRRALNLPGRMLRHLNVSPARSIWNEPRLQGPETLVLTSTAFHDDGALPFHYAGGDVGGTISPQLAWSGWSIDEFMDGLDDYIHWYNERRIKISRVG